MNRREDRFRIDLGRLGGVHIREHAGRPHGDAKKRKRGKGGQSHVISLDLVMALDGLDLSINHPVKIEHSLRYPGAPRGKKYRCRILAADGRGGKPAPDLFADLSQSRAAPKPAPSGSHSVPHFLEIFPVHRLQGMSQRDSDKCLRLNFPDALEQMALAHSRVDEDQDGSYFEQSESQSEEFDPGRHHQQHPTAAPDSDVPQTVGVAVALFVQLLKGHRVISNASRSLATHRVKHCDLRGRPLGCRSQIAGDIHIATKIED